MNVTTAVDVGIGLIVMYLSASLFVTVLNEFIAQSLQLRGKQLRESLRQVIDSPVVRGQLALVPTLAPFFVAGKRPGSYVDPEVIIKAVIGLHLPGSPTLLDAVDKLPESTFKSQLRTMAVAAKDDLDAFTKRAAGWLDSSLTMLGESYKRRVQWISFGLGIVVAVTFNLDTLEVVPHLYRDKAVRESIAAAATSYLSDVDARLFKRCIEMGDARKADPACKTTLEMMSALGTGTSLLYELPIGWPGKEPLLAEVWAGTTGQSLGGWLLTALALSLGAPFWFDLLNKFVNVRHGMKRPVVKEKP